MNETPKMHRRLEDRLAAAKAGKSLQIVVQGKCRVCKRRSATVPATKEQALMWFSQKATDGFAKYEVAMLTTGVHRECQKVQALRAKGIKAPAPQRAKRKVATEIQVAIDVAEKLHMEKVMRRRQQKKAAQAV